MPTADTHSAERLSIMAASHHLSDANARHEHTCYRYAQHSCSANPELTLIVSSVHKRDPRYTTAFREGRAHWYHMPVSTSRRQGIFPHQMAQIRYCVVTVPMEDPSIQQTIFVYPVLSIHLTAREHLSREQTGSQIPPALGEQQYWLFEFGAAIRLPHVVSKPNTTAFYFRLTQLSALQQGVNWTHLPTPEWGSPSSNTSKRGQSPQLLVHHSI